MEINKKKMIAAFTAFALAGGVLAGCDSNKAADNTEETEVTAEETTAAETTEDTEVTTEETTTAETTEETTEAPTEATTEESSEETTEETAAETTSSTCVSYRSDKEAAYAVFRAKAAELYEASGNADLAFSITYIANGNSRRYLLLVSDPEQGIFIYTEQDGEAVEYDIESPFEGDPDYRNRMFTYDQFMDLPFFAVMADLNIDRNVYDSSLPDGLYTGLLYGFSDDLSYAYAEAGPVPSFDMTPEQCMALTEDDTITVNGVSYDIGYIVDEDEYGYRLIATEGIDDGGYILYVYYGEDNVPYGVCVCDKFGEICSVDDHFRRIPVAQDCTVEVYDASEQDPGIMDIGQFRQFLTDTNGVTVYEDGGFDTGLSYIGRVRGEDRLPRHVTIENGQITYLTIRIDG